MAAALKSSRELMVKFEDQLRIKVLNNNYNPLRFSAYIIVPEKDHISISFDLQERRPIEDYFNVIEKKSLKVGLQTGIKDKQECIKHCYESTECLGWSFSDELCLFSKNLILDSDMRNDQNGTVGSRLVSTKYSELSNEKVAKNLENAISQGDFNLMIPFGKQVVPITATNLIEITVNGKLSIKREIEEKYTDIGNGYFEDVQYVAGVNTLSECYKLAESVQDPDVRGFQFEPDTKDCNLGLFRVVIGNEENRKNLTFKYMVDSMKLFESDDVPYYINKELKAFKSLRLTHTKDVESVKECLDECLFNSKSICRSLYFSPNEKECYMNQDYQWLPFNNVEKTSDTELTYRYRISTKPSFTRSDFILKFKESDIREMHEASTKTVASDCLENERCHGYLLCFKDSEDFIPTRAFVYERDNMTLSVASDYDLNILCSDNKRKENEYHLVRYTEEERVQIGGFAIFACCLLFLGSGFLIFGYLHLKNLYEYLKLRRK